MKKAYAVAALLGSLSTLFCCFLPVVFVSLGFGAAFAGLIGAIPQLTWLSQHKGWVFVVGGVLITQAAIVQWKSNKAPCPIDPQLAMGCKMAKRWSHQILFLATAFYVVGLLFAFVLPRLFS